MEFNIHEHYPTVVALEVHLENYQRIYFHPGREIGPDITPRVTTLIKFFELCQHDEFAQTILYVDAPGYYTWKPGTGGGWKRRANGEDVSGYPGIKWTSTLGRVHTVSPNQTEAFCLRILLHEVLNTILNLIYNWSKYISLY